MKKILLGIITLATLLVSCKKEDKNNDDHKKEDFYFTAKIDGVEFNADMSSCECSPPLFGTEAYIHAGILVLRGKKNSKKQNDGEIFIKLDGTIEVKTYPLEPGKNGPGAYYLFGSNGHWAAGGEIVAYNPNAVYSSGTGSVTITSHKDNIVEGTFTINGVNYQDATKKNITEGKFRMKYRTI